MFKTLGLIFFLFSITTLSIAQPTIGLQQIAAGFNSPVDIANAGDGRLFIVEQSGIIKIIDEQGNVLLTPFLDINVPVWASGNEQGLLGLAFHPNYANNGYFYVNYTALTPRGDSKVSRFSVNPTNPNLADPSSEVVLLTIDQWNTNHNGGDLSFGPDGYLYIGSGDGGGGGDPGNRAQNGLVMQGKMLRIDVDTTLGYKIPPDNPFVGNANVLDEIWSLGLRNPWRFSFDRLTGDMWIGDVGQNAWEEIDFQPANSNGGENYGWRCFEGNNSFNTSGCGPMNSYEPSIYDYALTGSRCAVIGGFVYRGCRYPNLYGHFVFADYCAGSFWTIYDNGGNWATTTQFTGSTFVTSFGEGFDGEIYVAYRGGSIHRITETVVNNTTPPSIIANNGTSFCTGNSISLTTQPNFSGYRWLLNGMEISTQQNINANLPGTYIVIGIDNSGCEYYSVTQVITENPLPSPVISASSSSFCSGDSLRLSTGNFASYLWSNGATDSSIFVKQPDNYKITVTDINGCSALANSVITEFPSPVATITQNDSLLSTENIWNNYQWFFDGNMLIGETVPSTVATLEGLYFVVITDENGCTDTAGIDYISTGIESVNNSLNIKVYPNPFKLSTTLTYDLEMSSMVSITIYNTIGSQQIVTPPIRKNAGTYRLRLDKNLFTSKGIYVLIVEVNGKRSLTKLFAY